MLPHLPSTVQTEARSPAETGARLFQLASLHRESLSVSVSRVWMAGVCHACLALTWVPGIWALVLISVQ